MLFTGSANCARVDISCGMRVEMGGLVGWRVAYANEPNYDCLSDINKHVTFGVMSRNERDCAIKIIISHVCHNDSDNSDECTVSGVDENVYSLSQ